jgi:hypothetical protein
LAYAASYDPFSRARRIFKVHPVVDGKVLDVTYVVKDFHPRDDVPGEKLLQDRILNSLNDEDATEARKYSMAIKHDECVSIVDGIDGSDEGKTPSLLDDWSHAKWTAREPTTSSLETGVSPHSQHGPVVQDRHHIYKQHINDEVPHRLGLHRRAHRRVVFDEVCQTIYEITNLYDLAQCLRDIVKGQSAASFTRITSDHTAVLNYFRIAGYVHRDVSGGNCLWSPSTSCGKISDLEFSKRYDQSHEHDPINVSQYLSHINS